jgi:hypothetical protein
LQGACTSGAQRGNLPPHQSLINHPLSFERAFVSLRFFKQTSQPLFQPCNVPRPAFPHHKNLPPELPQLPLVILIAQSIAFQLPTPKLLTSSGNRAALAARVAVPKTSVYKNDLAIGNKY